MAVKEISSVQGWRVMEGVPTLHRMVFEEELFKLGSEGGEGRSIRGAKDRWIRQKGQQAQRH